MIPSKKWRGKEMKDISCYLFDLIMAQRYKILLTSITKSTVKNGTFSSEFSGIII